MGLNPAEVTAIKAVRDGNPAEVTAIKAVRDGSNVRPFILYESQR